MSDAIQMNPECASGKHANCDGNGLDIAADVIVEGGCTCLCHPWPKGKPRHAGPAKE